jgi:hypothetical protein
MLKVGVCGTSKNTSSMPKVERSLSTTRTEVSVRIRLLVFLAAICAALPATAKRVVIPNVSAFVLGKNESLYGTEVRFYNPTSTTKRFVVVDWIGTEGWKPFEYTVVPGGILPIGGWILFNGDALVTGEMKYGAAVCEIDDGLVVFSRMLQATVPNPLTGIPGRCSEGTGGANLPYPVPPPNAGCVTGIGPTVEFGRDFFAPGEAMELLALDDPTIENNRTNLVIINPDSVASTALVQVHDSYGRPYEKTFAVPARTYFQVNDLYSLPEFRPLAVGGGPSPGFPGEYPTYGSPSRATVRCTTRCYAMGYVVSNFNNTVSASAPR